MARADLLLKLVRAGSRSDQAAFRRAVEAIIAEEREKSHNILAGRLEEALRNGTHSQKAPTSRGSTAEDLIAEVTPRHDFDGLVLPALVRKQCEEVVEEQHRADLLRSYNLEPRHRIMLTGPPGSGKTSLAEAMADALMYPFVVVRYESVIASYLGETASRLERLFEHVRTRRCVLFFDEFDTLGKERGDEHETGEIKRVVSSLLLQVDALPSHVVVITATNHPELLDRAAWRRFQLRLHLPSPTPEQIRDWLIRFEDRLGETIGIRKRTDFGELAGLSFAELEEFCGDVLRRRILRQPDVDVRAIFREKLEQWLERSMP